MNANKQDKIRVGTVYSYHRWQFLLGHPLHIINKYVCCTLPFGVEILTYNFGLNITSFVSHTPLCNDRFYPNSLLAAFAITETILSWQLLTRENQTNLISIFLGDNNAVFVTVGFHVNGSMDPSWYGSAFRIDSPLRRECTGHVWISLRKGCETLMFPLMLLWTNRWFEKPCLMWWHSNAKWLTNSAYLAQNVIVCSLFGSLL